MSQFQDDTEEVRVEEALVDHQALSAAALTNLTETQYSAVTAPFGPVLILAGAGTGKTRCLTSRIAWVIGEHKLGLQHVLAITFTRKAAHEMKERLEQMMGPAARSMHIGTFHSICIRILRENAEYIGLSPRFTVLDDDDQLTILKEVIAHDFPDQAKEVSAAAIRDALDSERNSDGSVKAWDVLRKNRKATDTVEILGSSDALENIALLYDGEKADAQVLDYNDIIVKSIELFEQNPGVRRYYQTMFRMVMIDEYQDTNSTQEHLIRLLLNPQTNITCVGDEDQSVYGWRGAEIKNILTFPTRYKDATVIKLEQNFRSTGSILDAANKLIAGNEDRLGKTLYTKSATGAVLSHHRFSDPRQEAAAIVNAITVWRKEGVPYSSVAILGRYATMFASLQLPLAQARIPFTITAGKKAQETQDIQNVIAYFRFAKNRSDDYALQRILTAKPRGLGPAKMKKVSEEARARHIPMIDAINNLLQSGELKGKVGDAITTLVHFLEELADDYQLAVAPAEIYQKIVVELEIDKDIEKATEKAAKLVERISRDKAHAGVKRRADRLAELQMAIASAPNLDEMVDSLALDPVENKEIEDGVWVGTIHAAKGLEFDRVILPAWSEGVFPSARLTRLISSSDVDPEDSARARTELEEERRLAYVALTRARQMVVMTSTEMFHGEYDLPPSRFIGEISHALTKSPTLR